MSKQEVLLCAEEREASDEQCAGQSYTRLLCGGDCLMKRARLPTSRLMVVVHCCI